MIRLKELREQSRLSQEGLAIKLTVSQSTISAYETGERSPDLNTLLAIANFFHVSLDYLAGKTDLKQQLQTSDLSVQELEYLSLYRRLRSADQEKVKAYIEGLLAGDHHGA